MSARGGGDDRAGVELRTPGLRAPHLRCHHVLLRPGDRHLGGDDGRWTCIEVIVRGWGNGFELNPSVPWLHSERGLPRVRIGSVDAFQGREFDVVYLSTTRSSKPGKRSANRFGFLVLPNRLCVAMSRQRKLLVAVGDAAQMTSPEGREAVPALAAFYDLTGGDHGFRRLA